VVDRSEETIVLDAGAVIGLSRNDRRVRARFAAARAGGAAFRVPMVVVAETVRGSGPRDAPVNLVLAQTSPQHPMTEAIARAAGGLLGAARSSSTVDALVVAEALDCVPAVILTSDPGDLQQLLAGHPGVIIEAI
jgi:predicted nucleic acid-binding protein